MGPEAVSPVTGLRRGYATARSYGAISSHRQADILQELRTAGKDGGTSGSNPNPAEAHRFLEQLLKQASRG